MTNDAARPFQGTVLVRLLNFQTGDSVLLQERMRINLKGGAGTVDWFCVGNYTGKDTVGGGSSGGAAYDYYPCQTPVTGSYTVAKSAPTATHAQCVTICNNSSNCVGFAVTVSTLAGGPAGSNGCSFYSANSTSVPAAKWRLGPQEGVDWWQKSSVPRFEDNAPVIPTCAVPKQMDCVGWPEIPAWSTVGCQPAGQNCLVELLVMEATSSRLPTPRAVSNNVQPFVPPFKMQLPRNVTVAVTVVAPKEAERMGAERVEEVQLSVQSDRCALYVVLTTQAAGRFSENGFLLEGGRPKIITFLSWEPVTDSVLSLLRASLRVEHLDSYL